MIRILIAEPDEGLRILLTEELVEEGYDVVSTAPDGLWQSLETERPHLVLLGLRERHRTSLRGLQARGLPVLFYGRSPLASSKGDDPRGTGALTAELDLKEIKTKIRRLLEGWGPSEPPGAGIANDPYRRMPQDQMHFDFSGGNGR